MQLEASIKNGDVQGFQLFSKAAEFLPLLTKKKDIILREHQEPLEEVSINGVLVDFRFILPLICEIIVEFLTFHVRSEEEDT